VDRINGSSQFWTRHFWVGAAAVLIVAAFNLTFHVRDNAIADWDESMYGQSAARLDRHPPRRRG
jgi:hypothetical protein